ncbi:hypothetical protein Afil01_39870 [Actinorhabdospora filicis]|uniref:Uncharacterized protein n=1 Tax=Actinorhabdospora filicis TaxID=1785913 RepID=A0A9W6SLK0_9ACTN|nr:hypothetical protein [Actinorhabdospora filicis]GLZ79180.1 hypothetical protein Afil01_39870 [Actinorhabdospora filicis]
MTPPTSTPFDPWPLRRRVLATAAAAAALTVVIAAIVATPPDKAPPGLAASEQDSGVWIPPTYEPGSQGSDAPGSSPGASSPPGSSPGPGTGPGETGEKPEPEKEPPPPPPAHVTGVGMSGIGWTGCSGSGADCDVKATFSVTTDGTGPATLSVTFSGVNGEGSRTFTYRLSGSRSYSVTAPGSKGSYNRTQGCTGASHSIVVTGNGDGHSASDSIYCANRG